MMAVLHHFDGRSLSLSLSLSLSQLNEKEEEEDRIPYMYQEKNLEPN